MLGRMSACRATHRTRRLPPEAQAETCQARAAELAQAVNLSSLSRGSMWSRRNVRRTSRAGSTRTRRVRSKHEAFGPSLAAVDGSGYLAHSSVYLMSGDVHRGGSLCPYWVAVLKPRISTFT